MDRHDLLDQLTHYGYTLMKPGALESPELLLETLLEQTDPRLLEAFPVVFANVLKQKESLAWEARSWPGKALTEKNKKKLAVLLSLSCYLFRLFGVGEGEEKRTLDLVTKLKANETFLNLNGPFVNSEEVDAGGVLLSSERLKTNFRQSMFEVSEGETVEEKKRALELELLLSELFAPKQKELIRKKLDGRPFTKTEREYFYRVVKKKLKALANEELHLMALRLLNS